VPFATATASPAPQKAANSRSNSSTRGPMLHQPERTTSSTASTSSSSTRRSDRGTDQRGGGQVRTGAADDCWEGLRQDRDVQPDRPVLEVVEVEPDEVVEAEARAARDLPEAGHAREHEVALAVPGLEVLVVAERQRPRADEAHLAAEHVPELRDLVEREAPQERADRGHARVFPDLEQRPVGVGRGLELCLAAGRVGLHRPELSVPESVTISSSTPARPARGALPEGRRGPA